MMYLLSSLESGRAPSPLGSLSACRNDDVVDEDMT